VWKSLSLVFQDLPSISIIQCGRCGGLLLARAEQKTRTCPYCGLRVELQRAKRLATAEDAFEASEMLRKIKAERQTNPRNPSLK
jgi:DNA-directed RNA polymerase subunit RPC12/RpoP